MLSVKMSSYCSCDVCRQYFAVKRVKCTTTVPPFCPNYQNNSILSQGFLGQRFNNLQKAALLTSFWRHRFNDKILSKFGQQQLVMVNCVCGFNQSEMGKYFRWIINNIIGWGFSRVKAEADNTFFFFHTTDFYLVTTLLMTILTFTWRKNKNKVQEIKEKYETDNTYRDLDYLLSNPSLQTPT